MTSCVAYGVAVRSLLLGVLGLAIGSAILLVAFGGVTNALIPLYAAGVFTSFTLSQAGMAKHHITHKEPGWRWGLFVNATGAFLSFVVDIIIAITKFSHGAWVVIVLVPILVTVLVRLLSKMQVKRSFG